MFCTPDDFNQLPYSIPNLNLVVNTFQAYIDEHEKTVLKKLLGVDLYYEFIEGRQALPGQWVASTPYVIGNEVVNGVSIWQALTDNVGVEPVEGLDWTLVEENNKWLKLEKGFNFVYSDSCCHGDHTTEWLGLNDMFIPCIFYYWLRDTWDNNSGIGVVQGKAENAEVIAPARRLVRSYNDFASKANTLLNFVHSETYFDPTVYNCCSCWPGTFPGTLNTFDL